MLTARQIAQRQHDVHNALASQRLEGLEPDTEMLEAMQRYITGQLELSDVLKDFVGRVARGEVHG